MSTKPGKLFVITLALLLSACGGKATEAPVITEAPAATGTPMPTKAPQFTPGPPLASMDLITIGASF